MVIVAQLFKSLHEYPLGEADFPGDSIEACFYLQIGICNSLAVVITSIGHRLVMETA